ncbi:MAG: hypothetical protein WCC57_10725 [Paracoccaceae bacterium]
MLARDGGPKAQEDMMPEFLPDLPVGLIQECIARAPGNEIKHGKFDSPESSAALVANAFGWFLERPQLLPTFPGFGGNAPYSVTLEAEMRFPWEGGRHPWLDVGIETDSLMIGVEAKRYEPFRPAKATTFPEANSRPVWGTRMGRYTGLARDIETGAQVFGCLNAIELIKDACAIRTRALKRAKQPVLVYLYAEPTVWAASGKPVDAARIAQHRDEIDRFGQIVTGDHVEFLPLLWSDVVARWSMVPALRAHASAVAQRFGRL